MVGCCCWQIPKTTLRTAAEFATLWLVKVAARVIGAATPIRLRQASAYPDASV
jgi:hypothetical protein